MILNSSLSLILQVDCLRPTIHQFSLYQFKTLKIDHLVLLLFTWLGSDLWWMFGKEWRLHAVSFPLPIKLHERGKAISGKISLSPLNKTERLHFHFSFSCIGEGNGNPLQDSCLENPRDRGAWWAAIYGVAQSQTRLKWLSSSSSSGVYI